MYCEIAGDTYTNVEKMSWWKFLGMLNAFVKRARKRERNEGKPKPRGKPKRSKITNLAEYKAWQEEEHEKAVSFEATLRQMMGQ